MSDLATTTQNLAAPPAIDAVNERRLDLLRKTVAKGATNADLATFLEVCGKYELDPYAKEAWLIPVPGKDGGQGSLITMVGRDGLRKIAQREGLSIDADVVRKADEFTVMRDGGGRTINHAYAGSIEDRGEIVGAWCEVVDRSGKARGFFYAPISEYRPTNERKLKYSPWGSQESVMILAAAERQALRQATPLSGIMAEGEDARIGEDPYEDLRTTADRVAEWAPSADLAGMIVTVVSEAERLGHATYADYATVELALRGQPEEKIKAWVTGALDDLMALEAEQESAVDAEVVEDPPEVPVEQGEMEV